MVSPPATGTFVHLGHVGFNSQGRVEASDDIEPGWTMMLEELQGYGVSNPLPDGDRDFVQGFLAGAKVAPLIATDSETPSKKIVSPPVSRRSSRSAVHRKPTVTFV